jgi:hypothetical protein
VANAVAAGVITASSWADAAAGIYTDRHATAVLSHGFMRTDVLTSDRM